MSRAIEFVGAAALNKAATLDVNVIGHFARLEATCRLASSAFKAVAGCWLLLF